MDEATPKELAQYYRDRVDRERRIEGDWLKANKSWIQAAFKQKYMYDFDWLGRPLIQLPGDLALIQDVVWRAQPTLIIETGVAHGGSLVLSASLLAMLDYIDWRMSGRIEAITESRRRVVGVEIDLRKYNQQLINDHPMSSKIELIDGGSTDVSTLRAVQDCVLPDDKVLVFLDSWHSKEHVLRELGEYGKFVTSGSFMIAFDTVVEDFAIGHFDRRPWGEGDGPLTAVDEYLAGSREFARDDRGNNLAMSSASRFGVLRKK